MKRLKNIGQHPLVREGAPLLGLYWLYSTIRWFVARENPYEAFKNAYDIIELEINLGIFFESAIQGKLIDHALWVVKIANEFYSWGYFPVLVLASVLLYWSDQDRFHYFKLTFLLGLGFALICFSIFPLAPPRMLSEIGFIDTQKVYGSGLYNKKAVLSFYNPYAAMPSLHFGWTLLVGIMAWTSRRRWLKALGALYPCSMALVVVITGHHYVMDILGGGTVVGLSYTLVRVLPRAIKEWADSPVSVKGNYTYRDSPSTIPRRPPRRTNYRRTSQSSYQDPDHLQRTYITALLNFIIKRGPPL